MTFEPFNKLESALMLAGKDPTSRPQFYRDFVASEIFVINGGEHPKEQGRLEPGYQLKIQSVQVGDKRYLPIFSSLQRLQMFIRQQADYLALNARSFLELTRGADVYLNPGAEYGKVFTAPEIAAILDGSIWKADERFVAQKDTQVLIGQPARYPTELVSALKRLFAGRKEVKRAWIAHYRNPERDPKAHSLIGVEMDGDWDQLMAEAGVMARSVTIPDPPVDFIQVNPNGGGIHDYFLQIAPFYQV